MIAPTARPPMTPAAIAPPRAEAGLAGAVATSATAATAARVVTFNMVFASPMWRAIPHGRISSIAIKRIAAAAIGGLPTARLTPVYQGASDELNLRAVSMIQSR